MFSNLRRSRRGAIGSILGTSAAVLLAIAASTPGAQGAAAGPQAAADTSTCALTGSISAAGGEYIIQNNEWNSSAQQCITYTSGTAWSVSTANFNLTTNGAPATYPSIYKGCHWGSCSANSGLPLQVSKITSAPTSWSTTQPASGAYDVAYDIWFNSSPTTTGQPDGTEMMIWINSRGGVQPFGSKTGTVSTGGHTWDVWTGNQTSWKIISYVLQGGSTSVSNLDVKPLMTDSVNRGSLNPSNYLLDAEAGFEIWQGGQGLATNSFSFQATAGTSGGDTTPPSTPSNLRATATTSNSASLAWSGSTDNVGVTGYNVYRGSTLAGTTAGTTFTDSGLSASTAYSYTVKAVDAAGNQSAASNAATATTQAGGGGGSGCTASLHVDNQWNYGFSDTVTVVNTGTATTHGWTVKWTWPNGQTITNFWSAKITQSGSSVTALNDTYNNAVAPGANTTFGVQGTWTGSNNVPTLTCTAS